MGRVLNGILGRGVLPVFLNAFTSLLPFGAAHTYKA